MTFLIAGLGPTRRLLAAASPLIMARDQLIPVVHGTTYEEVRKVSPLLGSRHGLDTAEDSMEVIATKIAELVRI
jgi:hypothetical protein